MYKQKILFNFYFLTISVLGGLIFIFSILEFNPEQSILYLFIITLLVIIEIHPVSLDVKGQVSLSFALNLAILIIYGCWNSIIVTCFGSALADVLGKRGWQKTIFNLAQYSISLYLSGLIYKYSSPITDGSFLINQHIIPFIFTAVTYVIINFVLVAIIVSLSFEISLIDVIKMDLGMVLLFLTSLAPMSLLMVILYTNEPWSVLLILPPLALAHKGFENYLNLRKQTRATIEMLADVIDRRDPYTASHSLRVAKYAEKIAKELNLSYEKIEDIIIAARVHDLGKIAIKENILLKAGSLDASEYEEMKKHAEIGFNILSPLGIYKNLVTFVLHHHEYVDGGGYPHGLKDKSIPLGARILAVADSFDAMISDRPYRKALSEKEAIQELLNNQGRQFDQEVVRAFIKVLEKESVKDRS